MLDGFGGGGTKGTDVGPDHGVGVDPDCPDCGHTLVIVDGLYVECVACGQDYLKAEVGL